MRQGRDAVCAILPPVLRHTLVSPPPGFHPVDSKQEGDVAYYVLPPMPAEPTLAFSNGVHHHLRRQDEEGVAPANAWLSTVCPFFLLKRCRYSTTSATSVCTDTSLRREEGLSATASAQRCSATVQVAGEYAAKTCYYAAGGGERCGAYSRVAAMRLCAQRPINMVEYAARFIIHAAEVRGGTPRGCRARSARSRCRCAQRACVHARVMPQQRKREVKPRAAC